MAWERYTGPRGGRGWRSTTTGEIRYQEDKPSEREEGGPGLYPDAAQAARQVSTAGQRVRVTRTPDGWKVELVGPPSRDVGDLNAAWRGMDRRERESVLEDAGVRFASSYSTAGSLASLPDEVARRVKEHLRGSEIEKKLAELERLVSALEKKAAGVWR